MERTMRNSSKKIKVVKPVNKVVRLPEFFGFIFHCILFYFFMVGVIHTALSFL